MAMTNDQIRERLALCKQAENKINKEMSFLNYTIKECQKKKKKLAIQVSKNMRYRNQLIDKLKK